RAVSSGAMVTYGSACGRARIASLRAPQRERAGVGPREQRTMIIAPGAFHLEHYLPIDRQRAIAARCRALIDGPVPGYVPTVRGGGKMHVRMLCLGRHWNGQIYQYEPTRSDFDAQPVPPLPAEFRAL